MAQDRDLRYDFVRVISMILIISIHVPAYLLYKYKYVSITDWNIANFIDSYSRMAIDIFIMISGALLLSKSESILSFYSKRVRKIIIPFIFWTVLYTFWERYYRGGRISIKRTLVNAVNTPVYSHLWFLYAIIILYLITPLIKLLLRYLPSKVQFSICILWLLIISVNFLNKFSVFAGKISVMIWPHNIYLKYIIEYGAYYILGYTLTDYINNINKSKTVFLGVLTFVSNFVIFIGTYLLSVRNGNLDTRLYDAPSIFVAISSVTGYIFLLGTGKIFYEKIKIHKDMLLKISYCSMGVYLVHECVMEVVLNNLYGQKLEQNITCIIALPLIIAVVSAISIFISYCGKKIPVIKYIF